MLQTCQRCRLQQDGYHLCATPEVQADMRAAVTAFDAGLVDGKDPDEIAVFRVFLSGLAKHVQ